MSVSRKLKTSSHINAAGSVVVVPVAQIAQDSAVTLDRKHGRSKRRERKAPTIMKEGYGDHGSLPCRRRG